MMSFIGNYYGLTLFIPFIYFFLLRSMIFPWTLFDGYTKDLWEEEKLIVADQKLLEADPNATGLYFPSKEYLSMKAQFEIRCSGNCSFFDYLGISWLELMEFHPNQEAVEWELERRTRPSSLKG